MMKFNNKQKDILSTARQFCEERGTDNKLVGPGVLLELVDHGDLDIVDAYYEWAVKNGYIVNS